MCSSRHFLTFLLIAITLATLAESRCLGGLGCYGYKCGTLYHHPLLLPKCNPCLRAKLYRNYWALKKPLLYRSPLLAPPLPLPPCGTCPLSLVPNCLKHKAALALCT